MKKAFTMLELIFVIIVIGILSAIILPSTKRSPLQEAAIQLQSHIRYTQHLALIDDKYDALDTNWYKKRWQIVFIHSSNANNQYAYTIYSDSSGGSTGDPNVSEIAINPENHSQLLTGGSSGGEPKLGINRPDFPGSKKLNLGMSYGVTDIDFSSSCSVSNSERLAFDYLGRPIRGKLSNSSGGGNQKAYEPDNLIISDCNITLSDGGNSIMLTIKPETGYVNITF